MGGKPFTATSTTLQRSPFFSRILEGDIPAKLDKNGRIYIERRPNVFGHILAYLIDFNQEKLTETIGAMEPLQRIDFLSDADFYQLTATSPYISLQGINLKYLNKTLFF